MKTLKEHFDQKKQARLVRLQESKLDRVKNKYTKEINAAASFHDFFWHFIEESGELMVAVTKDKGKEAIRCEIADVVTMCMYMWEALEK